MSTLTYKDDCDSAIQLDKVKERIKPLLSVEGLEEEQGYSDGDCCSYPEDKFDYKVEILKVALDVSNKIHGSMLAEEEKKSRSRNKMMIYLSVILSVSLAFIFTIVILNGLNIIHVDNAVIISSYTYVIANAFALIYVLVKYISENKLLDTFEKVTQRLLEFLINEKPGQNNTEATKGA